MNPEKCVGSHHPKWFGLALQALVILSKDNVKTCPSAELAVYLQSEATLLRRILATLAKGGILETREGRDGGYRLRRDPQSITLA
jgi:Rrf2 family transcriptional repressor of oqxAB